MHADPAASRDLGRAHARLAGVVDDVARLRGVLDDLATAVALADDDAELAAEVPVLRARAADVHARLRRRLVPRGPDDGSDAVLQVKAGEGGDESALFAADLLRMYLRYAERQGWSTQVLDAEDTAMGGVRSATVAVGARGRDADGVYGRLRHEAGVHRVQRVPATESQGRVHTSAAGVLVLPEADEVDVRLDPADLRVDVYRSSGPGGQSVNTTDSAVRITHLPTGVVVSCQNEKSQLQNREAALRVLRARLLDAARAADQADRAALRADQVRTVDRSERVRTYNFPQSRVTDHRVGLTVHSLDAVLDGDLDVLLDALVDAEAEQALAGGAPR